MSTDNGHHLQQWLANSRVTKYFNRGGKINYRIQVFARVQTNFNIQWIFLQIDVDIRLSIVKNVSFLIVVLWWNNQK